MDSHTLKTRYLDLMEQYYASLPSTMTEKEKMEAVIAVLDKQVATDLETFTEQAEKSLNSTFNDAMTQVDVAAKQLAAA